MRTRTWLVLFCFSLAVTVISGALYTEMSSRDPCKSPVFTICLIAAVLWLAAGIALVWGSVPTNGGKKEDLNDASFDCQTARPLSGDIRISPVHWAGLLVACLIGYLILMNFGLPSYAGYCLFNGAFAVLGFVASLAKPANA